jgi:putative endonuclease
MSNKSRRLYVGFTDNIVSRTVEHKEKFFPNSFTAQYVFDMLVYYEEYSSVIRAKMREKEIKGWRREKKLKLILAQNPDWADLSLEWQDHSGWNLEPEAQFRLKRKTTARVMGVPSPWLTRSVSGAGPSPRSHSLREVRDFVSWGFESIRPPAPCCGMQAGHAPLDGAVLVIDGMTQTKVH